MCSPLVKPNGAGGRREGISRCRSPERRGNCDKAYVSKARPAVQRPTQIYVPKVRPKVQRPDPLPAKTLGPMQIDILKIRGNFLPGVNLRDICATALAGSRAPPSPKWVEGGK